MNAKISKHKLYQAELYQYKADFLALIQDRLGITIHPHQEDNLKNAILTGCEKFKISPQDFLKELLISSEQSHFFEYLISAITIGETYFFRDQNQMRVLQETLFPEIIKKKRANNNLSLRIWSAGCATGEEIYTIAMILNELLPDIQKWNVNLLATDINMQSVQKAMAGEYTEWSMRAIQPYYKQKYFDVINKKYKLHPDIINQVNFAYLNLNDNNYPSIFNGTNSQDLIICRNVLIYFDRGHVNSIITKFNSALTDEGYILLGASDPIITTPLNLTSHPLSPMLLHRKIPETLLFQLPKPASSFTATSFTPKNLLTTIRERVLPYVKPKKSTLMPYKTFTFKVSNLIKQAEWQEALNFILENEKNNIERSAFTSNAKATIYANLGKMDEALLSCKEGLNLDATDKSMNFTFSLILIELNRLDEAEKSLRKVLFLDHKFVPAHFQLGLLQIRNKNFSAGLKSLQNALSIAENKKPQEKVLGSDLTYERLTDILKQEIQLHTPIRNDNHATD